MLLGQPPPELLKDACPGARTMGLGIAELHIGVVGMASFKAKHLSKPLVIGALLFAFAAASPLAISLGQTAPGSPIVSDVSAAGGTQRVLFTGAKEAGWCP